MMVLSNVLAMLLLMILPESAQIGADTLATGSEAPRFWANYLNGGDFFLSRKVGDKARLTEKTPIILSFFTTTCIPCRQEIPYLDSLQAEFPQVSFFLVDINEDPQIVKDYIQKMQYKIPVLIDRYGQVAKKYEASITPTLVCIDTDGRVVYFKRGFKASEKPHIRAQVKNLLPNKSAARK